MWFTCSSCISPGRSTIVELGARAQVKQQQHADDMKALATHAPETLRKHSLQRPVPGRHAQELIYPNMAARLRDMRGPNLPPTGVPGATSVRYRTWADLGDVFVLSDEDDGAPPLEVSMRLISQPTMCEMHGSAFSLVSPVAEAAAHPASHYVRLLCRADSLQSASSANSASSCEERPGGSPAPKQGANEKPPRSSLLLQQPAGATRADLRAVSSPARAVVLQARKGRHESFALLLEK